MDEVCRVFHARYPDVRVCMQPRGGTGAREEFLSAFVEDPKETLLGFCVTGGVFAEGIDLVGTRLIGAAVVGVSLPQPTPERDAMAAYYDELYEAGREYAYTYPGMNRVLQAAGRVIRTENDRGIVVLIDDRYATPDYRRLFPSHWIHAKYAGNAKNLAEMVADFWNDKPS
jgi:Rad3-related DNA helicase